MASAGPLDKNRIQGFGSSGAKDKCWTCPGGHLLQPWTAQQGICDGCSRDVRRGEPVMDCRACNFYLCEDCHPQEQASAMDSYISWVSSALEAVHEEVTELSQEVQEAFEAVASVVTCSAPPKTELEVAEVDLQKAQAELALGSPQCLEQEAEGAEEPEGSTAEPHEAEGSVEEQELDDPALCREPSDLMEMPRDDLITFDPEEKPEEEPDIHQEVLAAYDKARTTTTGQAQATDGVCFAEGL